MWITINGNPCEVENTVLARILEEAGYRSPHIATAVNGVFVHRQSRAEIMLSEGDRLEVVAPIEGG